MTTSSGERRAGTRATKPGASKGSESERGVAMLAMLVIMLFPLIGLTLFWVEPLRVALPEYLLGLAASAILSRTMMQSMRLPVRTGQKGMLGREVVVTEWTGRAGWVRDGDERWQAVARQCHR